jgi:hypothetical protein
MADTEPTAAEQPAAAAPQPVPVVRGPGGRFQKLKARSLPPLEERMAAKEREEAKAATALPDDENDSDDEESDDAPPAATSSPAAADPAKPADPATPKPKRETVEVEQKPNFAQERLEFTEWKRKQREAFDAHLRQRAQEHEQQLGARLADFESKQKEWSPRIEKAERVLKLMESADYEELAKEAGYENWEKFQGHVMGTITDPNYRETRALRRELEERKAKEKADAEAAEARAKQEREQAQARASQQQRAEAIRAHKQSLSEAMAKSSDRTVQAMADDPAFVNTVFAIQKENYDPSTNITVTPEQAIKMALRGGQRTVREELTLLYQRLRKAVGEEEAQQIVAAASAAPAPAAPAKPKAPKTGIVPTSATVEPAGSGKWTKESWREYRNKVMAEAMDAEEEAKRQKRAARGGR